MNIDLYVKALSIAKSYDVSTQDNSLVLYSVTNLPTKANREKAFEYVANNAQAQMIEHTACGAMLVELGMASSQTILTEDEVADIWREASRRMINEASGNVTVFVDNADEKSVFLSTELPKILENDKIPTINGIDKFEFAKTYK